MHHLFLHCHHPSSGVIAYVLLCGFPPFYAENEYQTLQLLKNPNTVIEFPSPVWDDVSELARNFILRLLNRDPDKRPTARQVLQDDPWLNHKHVQPEGLPKHSSFRGGIGIGMGIGAGRRKKKKQNNKKKNHPSAIMTHSAPPIPSPTNNHNDNDDNLLHHHHILPQHAQTERGAEFNHHHHHHDHHKY